MALTEKIEETAQAAENNEISREISKITEKAVNTPEPAKEEVFDGDIDLSVTRKKRFRINGDSNTVLELNT